MLSIGILYRSIELIRILDDMDITKERFLQNFPSYKYAQTSYMFLVSFTCGWLRYNSNSFIKPTEKGYRLISLNDPKIALRAQIRDVLMTQPPTWMHVLKAGRKQAIKLMSKDEIQCLESANLLQGFDFSIAYWWDEFLMKTFEEDARKRYVTGRKGEYLSLILEELRTKKKPILVSLDINFAGYDILSQTSANDPKQLYIEVKSSILNWNQATFTLSRNEWDVFTKNKNSEIYLWSFAGNPLFSNVTYEELASSIPQDQGKGKWKDVQIPFKLVKPYDNPFKAYDPINQKTTEDINRILNEKMTKGGIEC